MCHSKLNFNFSEVRSDKQMIYLVLLIRKIVLVEIKPVSFKRLAGWVLELTA